ncbi:MAG: hypothetical protein GVY32_05425 [Gammaproteobacteria bacterium]|jgi:hypothetical protein|nr:hypothetical protein [Gammaproteobacteria bacterium]
MARLIKTLFVLVIGSWLSLATFKQTFAQQPIAVPGEAIRIADIGLENQVPSAIDLIGPERGAAGRNRSALVHRLQCWIDGIESCSVADLNDLRIREIRRFLGTGPSDRDGLLSILFPDQSRIDVRLERVRDLAPDDWDRRVYEPVVLPDTVRAPGLPTVPSRPGELETLAQQSSPAIRAALERLRQRLQGGLEGTQAGSAADADPGLVPFAQGSTSPGQ